MSRPRVSYFMDNNIGGFYYGSGHFMKPHRIALTHNLVLAYGLYRKMEVYKPRKATPEEFQAFHSADYVNFLRRITPNNANEYASQLAQFNIGPSPQDDCPVFDGLYSYCQTYTGGSIDGARKLMSGSSDIAINWAGGLHHAKKGIASGFCYINDIVLAILDMLTYYSRVLYIDLDAHHGDGVEEAFYTTDRVMTVSFHRFGQGFFPQTGDIWDRGYGLGQYYSVNCPLKRGIRDEQYASLFKPVIAKVMEMFRPSAIVLQCGTDSLAHDRIGGLNLSIQGHGECVSYVKSFGVPLLVLGGGGYRIRNVARCWVYETGVLLDEKIDNEIPFNDYYSYFEPECRLHLPREDIPDLNSVQYLQRLKEKVVENLRCLDGAPSVQLQEVPSLRDLRDYEDEEDDVKGEELKRQAAGEFFDDARDQKMEEDGIDAAIHQKMVEASIDAARHQKMEEDGVVSIN